MNGGQRDEAKGRTSAMHIHGGACNHLVDLDRALFHFGSAAPHGRDSGLHSVTLLSESLDTEGFGLTLLLECE